jgi:hypothetical protein
MKKAYREPDFQDFIRRQQGPKCAACNLPAIEFFMGSRTCTRCVNKATGVNTVESTTMPPDVSDIRAELETRRRELGISGQKLSEYSGYAKAWYHNILYRGDRLLKYQDDVRKALDKYAKKINSKPVEEKFDATPPRCAEEAKETDRGWYPDNSDHGSIIQSHCNAGRFRTGRACGRRRTRIAQNRKQAA